MALTQMEKEKMAKTKSEASVREITDDTVENPRLRRLIIQNFRAIGGTPVEIDLDDIVVLVGDNNTGKSSILAAYKLATSTGKKDTALEQSDFHNADLNLKPTITLQTIVNSASQPAKRWIDDRDGEKLITERFVWDSPGVVPKRQGWDVDKGEWADNGVPLGADNVAKKMRPVAYRIDAFDSPKDQESAVIALLVQAIRETPPSEDLVDDSGRPLVEIAREIIASIQENVVGRAQERLKEVRDDLSQQIAQVFPGYAVVFDAQVDPEKINIADLIKPTASLLVGPDGEHKTQIQSQGSGARRTLMWIALKLLADRQNDGSTDDRAKVLLIDEPELCLHPTAIRECRDILYRLPLGHRWQVMLSTHSPVFIDISKDNTTVVRVERTGEGNLKGTTLYRPQTANLGVEEKQTLKLVNLYDPYLAEFFFGGPTIVVEGDTEYTAFRRIGEIYKAELPSFHVIRARGKYNIPPICKILNQFGAHYAVLHDADSELLKNEKKNPAWAANDKIREEVEKAPDSANVRMIASLPDFEGAYLNTRASGEKPYNALIAIDQDQEACKKVKDLLSYLLFISNDVPGGAIAWTTIGELAAAAK